MPRLLKANNASGLGTRLDRVTITGADDSVPVGELYELSETYPFVEWGILFSGKNQGSFRFPSAAWLQELADTKPANVKIAAHLCGSWVRATLAGQFDWWRKYPQLAPLFGRIQLNFHGEAVDVSALGPFMREVQPAAEFIFQCDGVNDEVVKELVLGFGGSPLYDRSGGAGISPDEWPTALKCEYVGYAGGIGPDNVVEVLGPLMAVTGTVQPFWIDMERKVRSDDDSLFELTKVHAVLERVADFVGEAV